MSCAATGTTASEEAAAIAAVDTRLLIGGEWRESASGARLAVEDPATGETLCTVADGDADDARAALDAAEEARAPWAASSPGTRAAVLRAAGDALRARCDELALLMTLEMGKPLDQAAGEVAYAADYMQWFAEEAIRIDGRWSRTPDGTARTLVTHAPVGPCLLLTPWNFPLAMAARKVAPAIAAGCTTVLKPAGQTPLSALALARVLEECGLPAGVLNVVTTGNSSAMVGPLLSDPRLRKLSFTGSTAVGSRLMAQAAANVLRVSMELGGNAPFIVFADAQLDAAVAGALTAKLRNMGQACTAANRFYVHADLHDEFVERLAAAMAGIAAGRGTEPGVQLGPLIDAKQLDVVARLVDEALLRGATAVVGGRRLDDRGHFYAPTVLSDVALDDPLLRQEIFGPVAPVARFSDDEEALGAANGSELGLAAYLYTQDHDRVMWATEQLEAGMVAVNQGTLTNATAPFGGVKHSGFGREGGREGIEEYLSTKQVAIRMARRAS